MTVMTDIDAYLSFVLKLFLAFGLAFEIPVATMLLVKAGIASPESLKQKRPYVFIGCFVIGMLITPPDVISQTLLAVPMWLLFEAGLIGARFVGAPRASDSSVDIEETSEPSREERATIRQPQKSSTNPILRRIPTQLTDPKSLTRTS